MDIDNPVTSEKMAEETQNFVTTSSDQPEPITETNEELAVSDENKNEESSNDQANEVNDDGDSSDVSADETANESSNDQENKPDEKNDTSAQIDDRELLRARIASEQKLEQMHTENEQLKAKVVELQTEKPIEPHEEDFDDYEAYLDALDEYDDKLDQFNASRKLENHPEEQQEQKSNLTQNQETALKLIREAIKADDKKPADFTEITTNDSLPITSEMLEVICECEDIPKLLYHLGKNISECQKLAEMRPAKMAMAIAKIDSDLNKPIPSKPVKNTKAPDPINPVSSRASHQKQLNQMSYSEYEKFRNEQEKNSPKFI